MSNKVSVKGSKSARGTKRYGLRPRALTAAITTGMIAILGVVSFLPSLAATGSGTLYLTPSTGTYNPGNTIAVDVRENSSGSINAVTAAVNYPTNLLDFVSLDSAGSGFDFPVPGSGAANGKVTYQALSTTPLTGDKKVVTINFKVKSGVTGTASLSFSAESNVVDPNGANTDPSLLGSSYTLKAATVPTCPSGQTGTPPNCVTPAAPTTPSTPSSGASSPTPAPKTAKATTTATTSIKPQGSSTPVSVASGSQVQISAPATMSPDTASSPGDPVIKAQYYLDKKLLASVTAAPYTYRLNTTNIRNGQHTFTTKTFYLSGKISTSSQKLNVKNPPSLTQTRLVAQHYALPATTSIVAIAAIAFFVAHSGGVTGLMGSVGLGGTGLGTLTGGFSSAAPPPPPDPDLAGLHQPPHAPGTIIRPENGAVPGAPESPQTPPSKPPEQP